MEKSVLILLYLIIGHLIGDFLLQTSRLVTYKRNNFYGIILHGLIVLFSHIFLFLPYLFSLKICITLLFVGFLHFYIDFNKIKLNIKTKYPIIPFAISTFYNFI